MHLNVPTRRSGYSLLELMIVVTLLAVLLSIAVPGFLKARDSARQTGCQENLVAIDNAVQRYVIDNNVRGDLPLTITVLDLVGDNGYLRYRPVCPSGGEYLLGTPDDYEPVTCTIRFSSSRPHVMPQALAEGATEVAAN